MLLEVPTSDGTLTAGGYLPAVDGLVRNLEVKGVGFGSFSVRFDWESGLDGEAVLFFVYLDRVAVGQVRPGEVWESSPIGDEEVEVLLVPVRMLDGGAPDISGEVGGDQVFLDWSGNGESDVVSYRVYTDNKTGTMDYTGAGLFAEVSRVVSDEVRGETGGTGTGRLVVSGIYHGARVNGVFAVEVTTETGGRVFFQYDAGGGLNGTDIELRQGVAYSVAPGLRALFLDAVGGYEVGDRWEWMVGPETRLVKRPASSGTYKFAVRAVDAAGHESDSSAVRTVVVVSELEAPPNAAVVYDRDAETLTFSWGAIDDVRVETVGVFANFDGFLGELVAYVQEEVPWVSAPSADGVVIVDVSGKPFGTWLFYLRSGDVGLAWERNATLLRVTMADLEAAVLRAVELTGATAAAGGKVRLEYVVNRVDSDPADLKVYAGASASWDVLVEVEEVEFVATGFPVSIGVLVTADVYTGLKYFGVRPVDEEGRLGPVGNILGVTADDTAPGAPVLDVAMAT